MIRPTLLKIRRAGTFSLIDPTAVVAIKPVRGWFRYGSRILLSGGEVVKSDKDVEETAREIGQSLYMAYEATIESLGEMLNTVAHGGPNHPDSTKVN